MYRSSVWRSSLTFGVPLIIKNSFSTPRRRAGRARLVGEPSFHADDKIRTRERVSGRIQVSEGARKRELTREWHLSRTSPLRSRVRRVVSVCECARARAHPDYERGLTSFAAVLFIASRESSETMTGPAESSSSHPRGVFRALV